MIQRALTALALSLCFFLVADAAPAGKRVYLPILRAPIAALQTTPVLLYDGDVGTVNAIAMRSLTTGDLRFILGIAKRPAHKLEFFEDVNGVLVPLDAATAAALLPAFIDDGPKHGGLSMIAIPGGFRAYYTGRAPDDPTGVFKLWRVERPVPDAEPAS